MKKYIYKNEKVSINLVSGVLTLRISSSSSKSTLLASAVPTAAGSPAGSWKLLTSCASWRGSKLKEEVDYVMVIMEW
jgi:hypothetical protein